MASLIQVFPTADDTHMEEELGLHLGARSMAESSDATPIASANRPTTGFTHSIVELSSSNENGWWNVIWAPNGSGDLRPIKCYTWTLTHDFSLENSRPG